MEIHREYQQEEDPVTHSIKIGVYLTEEDIEHLRHAKSAADGFRGNHYYMEYNATRQFTYPFLRDLLIEAERGCDGC